MLQQEKADDYVIATGECHSVREFLDKAFSFLSLNYEDHLEVDPAFYRPAETMILQGNYSKAKRVLGWEPTVPFSELVREMVQSDLDHYGQPGQGQIGLGA